MNIFFILWLYSVVMLTISELRHAKEVFKWVFHLNRLFVSPSTMKAIRLSFFFFFFFFSFSQYVSIDFGGNSLVIECTLDSTWIQIRDFEYNSETQETWKQEIEKLMQDQDALRTTLLQWCYTSYGEVLSVSEKLLKLSYDFYHIWTLIKLPWWQTRCLSKHVVHLLI